MDLKRATTAVTCRALDRAYPGSYPSRPAKPTEPAVAAHEVGPSPPSLALPQAEPAASAPAASALPAATAGPKRPAHSGLTIRFRHRPEDAELGRLEASTVLVD